MPEVYKKFRDSQGLASISLALKASRAAEEAPKQIKTRKAEAGEGSKGQPHKKNENRSASGHRKHVHVAQTSDTAEAAATRKKKRRAIARENADAGPDADLAPSLAVSKQAGSHPSTGMDHGKELAGMQQTFRDYYVKTFSSAFASELYDLRQVEGEKFSLGLLLRQIESGINIFSDDEKELLQQEQRTA